jgi:nitrite reductase/ring-hydroxylating ferredoxin subunit
MRYVPVAKVADIKDDEALQVIVDGHPYALLWCEGQVRAVDDICTHEHAYLSEGFVEDCTIECPLHGSQFDARTGKVLSLPATQDLPVFEVKVEGDEISIGIPE